MALYLSTGEPVALGTKIHNGGEGTVYRVQGHDDAVAKIYDVNPAFRANEAKLKWMLGHPLPSREVGRNGQSVAWPEALVYDGSGSGAGSCIGFIMPYIRDVVPMSSIMMPRQRVKVLPGFGNTYLYRTARNLASVIAVLHEHDYVVGDLNESNVRVTPSAKVVLIDMDSIQVKELHLLTYRVHRCRVGKEEYTPRELHRSDFEKMDRSPDHDCFALGVLIFQLLMGGSHPFRSDWRGKGDPPSIMEKIARGYFPYPRETGLIGKLGAQFFEAPPVLPPPGAGGKRLSLDALDPQVAALMQRCFLDGHSSPGKRPSAREWANVLRAAEARL